MEPRVLFRCTGSCGGVTDDATIAGCGLEGCEKHGEPLTKVLQCEACEAQQESDGQSHACDNCPAA